MRSIVRNESMSVEPFTADVLKLDLEGEADRIAETLKDTLRRFKKKGIVVAMSGGIDSSVVTALSVRSLGKDRVFGVLMPERDSASETLQLSRGLAEYLGIRYAHEDITPLLEASGCYRRRDDAIRRLVPDYSPDCKSKIVLPPVADDDKYRFFTLVVQYPNGKMSQVLLDLDGYLGVVAASNFKQRTRKMIEYYHADRLNYLVAGTPIASNMTRAFS